MIKNKEHLAELGLLLITVWAALQYTFLSNVPDTVSTFSFLTITNLMGFVILGIVRIQKFRSFSLRALGKGAVLGAELIGFNFFLTMGSKNMDSVVISSVVSMYFIFIPPIMLLMKKKISFRSVIASCVAIIALLLMFQADTDAIFSSSHVIYLIICDLFFAVYVITISVFNVNEDSVVLTLSQMLFSCLFAFVGWLLEIAVGRSQFGYPTDFMFWIAVLYMGIFIRALYGIIQVTCQKYVKPINASLIFSAEIIITLLLNPVMASLFHTSYTPATAYQVIGCILFVISILVADDGLMKKFGYNDMEEKEITDFYGKKKKQTSISVRLINMTLAISMTAVILSVGICVYFLYNIRDSAVLNSENLGNTVSTESSDALKQELETEMNNTVQDKALLTEAKLNTYMNAALYAADYAKTLLENPDAYEDQEVLPPNAVNKGTWVMQRTLTTEDVSYEEVKQENLLLGNMENVFRPITEQNTYISTIYLATEEGLMVAYDPNSINNGEEDYYDYLNSEWYQEVKASGKAFFSSAYQDNYGRGLTISCIAPVIDENGTFRGAIGIDILIKDMNASMISDGIFDPSRAILFDKEGHIMASRETDDDSSGTLTIYESSETENLREIADQILSGSSGITQTSDGELYVAYAYIDLAGWIMCVTSPVSNITSSAEAIRTEILENTHEIEEDIAGKITIVVENCLLILALIILIITMTVGTIAKKITEPLKQLAEDVDEISKGNFDRRTSVDTSDEVGDLANAFNYMTASLQENIRELTEATAKEERIASELAVATKIQADMLPNDFPAFPERTDFDLYASMDPAKEVGGDFYDFFLIDENHLAMVMADVSGKGVPAALFMAISKALIRSRALMGGTPGEILTDVNNQLAENNKEDMFVTVWLGILDLTSGVLISANAGHEYPIIRKQDGLFEVYKKTHQMVLGGIAGIRYKNAEKQIDPGDEIFLYTDGVPEAMNAGDEQYGMERLLQSLNASKEYGLQELLVQVRKDLDSFVNGAEQFDDITMMAVKYQGGKAEEGRTE